MHKIMELKERLIDELEEYADKPSYSTEDVMEIKYLSSAIDHMCNMLEKCDEDYDGYSHKRRYSRSMRRDSMGRYSKASENFKMGLEELLKDAPNDHIRQKMQDVMYEM